MKKPTLGELAQIAEVVAAVAVIISLVYVGRELRSNTAAVKAASVQAVSDVSSETLLTMASDSALSRIRLAGSRDPASLTELDAYRYGVLMRQFWLIMQNVYLQNELEVIDARIWRGYERIICEVWTQPGVRANWPGHRNVLEAGFAAVVEECPG